MAKAIEARGGVVHAHRGDLTPVAETTRLVDATPRTFDRWDIPVNTAGKIVREPIAEFEEDDFDALFAIDAEVPFFSMREASKRMRDHGRILDLATTVVAVTAPTFGGHAGSKSPAEHFTNRSPRKAAGAASPSSASPPGRSRPVSSIRPRRPRTCSGCAA